MQIIWVRNNWERFIQYTSNEKNLDDDTMIYRTIELSKEQLNEIKNCYSDKIQEILKTYL